MIPRVDVVWVPSELPDARVAGTTALVIDVIRATTSMVTALAAGARRVEAVERVEEARARAGSGVLLCGERQGLPPPGFDLGNSPGEYTPERVGGRTLVFTTTNGTRAMRAAIDRVDGPVRLACFRNATASATAAAAELAAGAEMIVVVCAGGGGRVGMDDAWCAGHVVDGIAGHAREIRLTDGARRARDLARGLGRPTAAALAETPAGRRVVARGLGEDLSICARLDDLDVAPVWQGDAFVKGGEDPDAR